MNHSVSVACAMGDHGLGDGWGDGWGSPAHLPMSLEENCSVRGLLHFGQRKITTRPCRKTKEYHNLSRYFRGTFTVIV